MQYMHTLIQAAKSPEDTLWGYPHRSNTGQPAPCYVMNSISVQLKVLSSRSIQVLCI